MKSQIIIIAGRSGSGKTTLAKALAEILGFDEIGFSYAGRILSTMESESDEFRQIEDYIYSCIKSSIYRADNVVIDGLASKTIYERLLEEGYDIKIIFLDTPKSDRIDRIAERERCPVKEAEKIEAIKAKGKASAGLEYVISKADTSIDGRLDPSHVLKEALQFHQHVMENAAKDEVLG